MLTNIVSKKEAPIDILEIDNTAVRKEQIERLAELKEGRDEAKVQAALDAITKCVKQKRVTCLNWLLKQLVYVLLWVRSLMRAKRL